jgi:hypothetical protein
VLAFSLRRLTATYSVSVRSPCNCSSPGAQQRGATQQRGSSVNDTLRTSIECERSPKYPHARHQQSRAGQILSKSTFADTGEGSGVRARPRGRRRERWWKVSRNVTYNPTSARREVHKRKARTVCARRVRKAAVRRLVNAGPSGAPTRISHGFARPSPQKVSSAAYPPTRYRDG